MDKIFLTACKNGQKGVVEAFLKKGGVNINVRDESGSSPLFLSCQRGARDIATILIAAGADVSLANNESVEPLHMAAKSGNKDIMEMLLGAGAFVDSTDKNGKTPLIYAVKFGKAEAAAFLLGKGADKQIKDNQGNSAVNYASSGGVKAVIDLLMDGAEVKDSYGNTALHQAVFNEQAVIVKEILQSSKGDVVAQNDNGETPLVLSARKNNLQISEMLLGAGANPLDCDENGNAPVHFAASFANKFLMLALIAKDADLSAKNINGQTPLIIAAINGANEVVAQLLATEKCDVNAADNIGHTAVYYASERGYTEIVENLIMAGASM